MMRRKNFQDYIFTIEGILNGKPRRKTKPPEALQSWSSRSRNLLSGKVLLIEVKLRSSSFVRDAFAVQVDSIKFEKCGWNMADVQNFLNLIG